MKSVIAIVTPFVLVFLLVTVLYSLQSRRFDQAGVKQADPSIEKAALSRSEQLLQAEIIPCPVFLTGGL